MSKILPKVTAVIDELYNEYKDKDGIVLEEIKLFRSVLYDLNKKGYKPKKQSLTVNNSQLDNEDTSSLITFTERSQVNNIPSKSHLPRTCCNSNPSFAGKQAHQPPARNIHEEIEQYIDDLDAHIKLRKKPNKRAEFEKESFLLELETKWESDLETFQLFEPDLVESMFKSLCILDEKRSAPEIPTWPLEKMVNVEALIEDAERNLENAQAKINQALNEDLSLIDFDRLKSEGNTSLIIGLYKLTTALKDIRKLKPAIVYKDTFPNDVSD